MNFGGNGRWFYFGVRAFLSVASLGTGSAWAAVLSVSPSTPQRERRERGESTWKRFSKEYARAAENVMKPETGSIFLIGAASAFAASFADTQTSASRARGRHLPTIFDFGNFWGTPFPALAVISIGAVLPPDNSMSRLTTSLSAALIATTAITTLLKYSIGRERPSGANLSLPSGHTAVAFATATLLDEYCGHRVGAAAFVLAAFTAASRVMAGAHWLSDTAAGATIGLGVGQLFRESTVRQGNTLALYPYAREHRAYRATEYGALLSLAVHL